MTSKLSTFFLGFGCAAIMASLHDPVGAAISLGIVGMALVHEWLVRLDEATSEDDAHD